MAVFDNVKKQLNKVQETIKLKDNEMDYLERPKRIIEVNFRVKMVSGNI